MTPVIKKFCYKKELHVCAPVKEQQPIHIQPFVK